MRKFGERVFFAIFDVIWFIETLPLTVKYTVEIIWLRLTVPVRIFFYQLHNRRLDKNAKKWQEAHRIRHEQPQEERPQIYVYVIEFHDKHTKE